MYIKEKNLSRYKFYTTNDNVVNYHNSTINPNFLKHVRLLVKLYMFYFT